MIETYNLKMPHSVFSGKNALENISAILKENHVQHLAVFTDQGIRGAGLLELPMAWVEQSGVDTVILDDLPAEPTLCRGPEAGGPVQGLGCGLHHGGGRRKRHGHCQAGQHPDD